MAEETQVTSRLQVVFDIDGVVYPWEPAVHDALEIRGYDTLIPSQRWDHIKEQVRAKDWEWLWRGSGLRLQYDRPDLEFPGAGKVLRHVGATCDLHFVTHRPTSAAEYTARWIAARKCRFTSIHVIGHQTRKSDIMIPDVFVDDKAENVIDMLEASDEVAGRTQVFMPRREYNTVIPDDYHPRLTVYSSLKEVSQWVKQEVKARESQ